MNLKVKEIINQILVEADKPIVEELSDNMTLQNDIGLDSLELAELTVNIEAEFGIDIFADGIVETVGELLSKLENE